MTPPPAAPSPCPLPHAEKKDNPPAHYENPKRKIKKRPKKWKKEQESVQTKPNQYFPATQKCLNPKKYLNLFQEIIQLPSRVFFTVLFLREDKTKPISVYIISN